MKCIRCKEREIHNKKRSLCELCYQKFRGENGQLKSDGLSTSEYMRKKKENFNEVLFIRNFFDHNEWLYEPAIFYFDDRVKYIPDFYDVKRNVFIEVAGTRQAFHANKDKYLRFAEVYPKINFEIRTPAGELLESNNEGRVKW